MAEDERTSFVSRKEFYAGTGMLWMFLMLLASVFLSVLRASDDLLRVIGVLMLMAAALGMGLYNMIRASRERSRPAETRSGEVGKEHSR